MLPLTDGLLKMMNFKYVFRWHVPFLLLFLFTCRAMAADTLVDPTSMPSASSATDASFSSPSPSMRAAPSLPLASLW